MQIKLSDKVTRTKCKRKAKFRIIDGTGESDFEELVRDYWTRQKHFYQGLSING